MGNPFSRTIREPSEMNRTDPSIPGHVNYVTSDGSTNESDSAIFHRLPPLPSGPPMAAPVTPERGATDRYEDMARLKLQSHQVKPFSGRSAEFPKWRSHTECVFNGTGYEQVLVRQGLRLRLEQSHSSQREHKRHHGSHWSHPETSPGYTRP